MSDVADGTTRPVRWVIDGNNVFGSRPDGWWNDRPAAQRRFTQRVAEWCRAHDDDVTLVFDAPVAHDTALLAGGNLSIVEAERRGRNAADDEIVELVEALAGDDVEVRVVTSDRGLRGRLPPVVEILGVGSFRDLVGY
jgi:predicted RNA-binding protein with PIN domain